MFDPTVQALGRATVGDAIRRQGQRQPAHLAVVQYGPNEERIVATYAQLADRAARCAAGLKASGLSRGDCIAIMAPSSLEYIEIYVGAAMLGVAVTGMGWKNIADDVVWQVNHADAQLCVVGAERAEEIDELRDQMPHVHTWCSIGTQHSDGWITSHSLFQHDPLSADATDVTEDDLLLITYTSGSENRPKGVQIPHRNYVVSTTFSLMAAGYISPRDVYLFIKPFHTIAGLGSITSLLLVGATLVLVEPVSPSRVLDVVAKERITTISQTPTFYTALTQHPDFATADVSSLRQCHTYGGLVSRHMLQAFAQYAPHVEWASYWGQSELTQLGTIGWFSSFDDIPRGDPRWIGVPTPSLEVRVVDSDGNDAELGEMLCRTPSVMRGYHKDPERTAEVIDGGWVHTGDLVQRDENGNLFFVDRIKDVVKTGGMNVSSLEVEDALLQHPAIGSAAVVGLPDEYWGEAVTAFVVARPGHTVVTDEVISFVKQSLTTYKVPKAVHLLDVLPTDPQGKIRKRELRAQYAHNRTPSAS